MNLASLIALSITAATAFGCATSAGEAQTTKEGLVATRSADLDELYVQPDLNLSTYRKVFVEPVGVALRDDYITQRHAYNRFQPIYPRYQEAESLVAFAAQSIREGLADAFKARGYEVLDVPQAGALSISARVTELYVNAPDRLSPWLTRNLTRDAGQATLSLEARDAAQGTVLARVVHHLIVREVSRVNLASDVSNGMWLDSAFRRWAANCAAALSSRRAVAVSGS